jgi:hypothetical protein
MKRPKHIAKKERNRNPGQIEKLAHSNPVDAQGLAIYGRLRSDVEKIVSWYLHDVAAFERASRPDNSPTWLKTLLTSRPSLAELHQAVRDSEERLCKMSLAAARNRDVKTLRAIADAVEGHDPHAPADDGIRADVLMFKEILCSQNRTMELTQLAKLVLPIKPDLLNPAKAHNYNGDDLSWLRRVAKKLNFPLTKAKPGRPTKSRL